MKEAFVGFDSAWAGDRAGAIAYAIFQGNNVVKESLPRVADFADAAGIIEDLQSDCDDVLVAIDQPTIVPCRKGSRPVEKILYRFMAKLGSTPQPANRCGKPNKAGMFGDNAPAWKFINKIGPPEYSGRTTDSDDNRSFVDFKAAQTVTCQTHLIEVYPALAWTALNDTFMDRKRVARYDPDKDKFCLADWRYVCEIVHCHAAKFKLQLLAEWATKMIEPWGSPDKPKKPHQDKIDAALCLLVALQWRRQTDGAGVIGDIKSGYIVTPTSDETRKILKEVCNGRGVYFKAVE